MGILFSRCLAQRASPASENSFSLDGTYDDYGHTPCVNRASPILAYINRRHTESILHHWRDQPAPGEGRVEATARIMENFQTKEGRADLSYLNLSTLPPIMHNLFWLQELNLSHNNLNDLSRLPAQLDCLDINHNQFTVFPENLPENLAHLCIGHNHLTELPADRLPKHLRYLNISHNQLRHLPEEPLEEIESLIASHNQLTHLPDNLRLSTYLQILEVSHNQLTHLPNNFFRHANSLSGLVAHHNYLTYLPEDIVYAPRHANISVEDNLFPGQVLIHLRTSMNTPGYSGPRIYFSMATEYQDQRHQTTRTLGHAVAIAVTIDK